MLPTLHARVDIYVDDATVMSEGFPRICARRAMYVANSFASVLVRLSRFLPILRRRGVR